MIVKLPKASETAVYAIESFFSSDKVKSSCLKIEMENTIVDHEDIGEYVELTLEQFKLCSDDVKFRIKKLKFDGEDSLTFAFDNKTDNGAYQMTLITGVKNKDGKHKIFIYYYSKTCQYTNLSSWWRSLFGTNTKLNSILTENNLRSFLVYKLAKYAQDFDSSIQIEFSESETRAVCN